MNEHWERFPVVRGLEEVEPILKVIADKGYIAGSYAAYMASSVAVAPGDIDVFAVAADDAFYIATAFCRESGSWYESNDLVFTVHRMHKMDVQVVKPHPDWKRFPDDILNSFDMDICRALYVDGVVLADENVGCSQAKFLRINNPLRSLRRALKYHKREVEFNDHELVKLFLAWDNSLP